MYRTIKALYPVDNDMPARTRDLLIRHAILDGTFYDVLPNDFHQERNELGDYIPMAQRAPSVRHGLCRTVVNDSVSLLFSEGRFPEFGCDDEPTREGLTKLAKDCALNMVMIEAAAWGSTGSVAIFLQAHGGRLFVKPRRTTYLTPDFDPMAPDRLIAVTERYKVKGRELIAMGYPIDQGDMGSDFWFQRVWDHVGELWYVPQKVLRSDNTPLIVDTARSIYHNLGFCPCVWVRNLPGGDEIDGTSTFDPIGIENQIEMDYQMSAGGRGLKYTSSPTLVLRTDDPKAADREHVMGDALIVPSGGDAHHLEISGQAIASVLSYCEAVRKLTLEALGGSRADPDKLSAAQSGRAMEMLNQSLIWLADKLRASYGEGALLSVLRMAMQFNAKIPLIDRDGDKIGAMNPKAKLTLKWSPWYPPTYQDQQVQATAITTLRDGKIMSTRTAVGVIAPVYDIEDVDAELEEIEGDANRTVDLDVRKAQETRPYEYEPKDKS